MKIKTQLKYFGLVEEFYQSFDDKEIGLLEMLYQPFVIGEGRDDDGDVTMYSTTQSKLSFLTGLLGYIDKIEYYEIGKKLIRVIENNKEHADILDLHFYFQHKIQFYYRRRNDKNEALENAIQACLEQISISESAAKGFKKDPIFKNDNTLPVHIGFKQLAIIYDHMSEYQKCIQLCRQAKSQGWNENWDKRIEKAIKKLSKLEY